MGNIANRIIKNTMFLYIRMGVSIVFSFFTTRFLLQALGASDYGLYNVVAGSLSMLGFLSASMSSTTQRFISYAEGEGNFEKIKTIFNNAVFLHNVIAAIVGVIFVLAGFAFFNGVLNIPDGRTVTAIAVYGCMIFSTVFAVTIVPYDAVLNAHENMKFYSILGIVDVLLKFAIALVVMFSDTLDQLLFYGILMAVESWFFRFLTKLYCVKQYEEVRDLNRKKYVEKGTLKEMTSFAGWNMLNISTGMISLYGMGIVLNHYFGTSLNAALGISQQVAGVILGVTANMTKALTPALVKSEGARDRKQMIYMSMEGCKFSYLLFAFFSIPIAFCINPLLNFWLKEVPDWTDLFCLLMIVSNMIEQLFYFLYYSINAQGDIRNYSIARSITNILPLIVMMVQFKYGYLPYYALIDWILFKILLGGVINLYFSYKNYNLPIGKFLISTILPLVLATFIISSLSFFFRPTNYEFIMYTFLRIFVVMILSIPIYWFFVLNNKEKQVLLRCVKHIKFSKK